LFVATSDRKREGSIFMTSYFTAGFAAAVLLSSGAAAFAAQHEAVHVSVANGCARSAKIVSPDVGARRIVLGGHGLNDADSENPTAAMFSLAAASLLEASQH
jgi:hypothetical protein